MNKEDSLLNSNGFTPEVMTVIAEWAAVRSKENIPEIAYIPMKRVGIKTLTVVHAGKVGTPESTVTVTTTMKRSILITKRALTDTILPSNCASPLSFILEVLRAHILDYYVDVVPVVQLKREFREFFKNYMFEDKRGKYARIVSTIDGILFLVFTNDISAPAKKIVHPFYHDQLAGNRYKQYFHVPGLTDQSGPETPARGAGPLGGLLHKYLDEHTT